MHTFTAIITNLLIDHDVKLDGDQIEEAERSITARMIFDQDGSLITPLRVLVEGEKAARPDLFEKRK